MFTGIINSIGTVKKVSASSKIKTFSIECPGLSAKLGDSIAINGTCLTIASIKGSIYTFDVVKETLSLTTLGTLKEGSHVNLEKSLTLQSGIDGHLVTGHVDCVATVTQMLRDGNNIDISVRFPKILKKFIAKKGSITLNGVSLTVTKVTADSLSVTFVPHTLKMTTLKELTEGDGVNLEVDVLARYVYNATR